ncbi:polyketide synthase [Thelonectria olida]|uniref:Polyketide synthase n=1 Tax=Thelonectria olida TaxID=1576542 RepID=A0A9P8VTC7_9HYPO|nr:polyketide synthase [Thelonectria olida]
MFQQKAPQEPIAIVGSSCRFASDTTSPSKLWELLKEPRDIQTKIPDTRFSVEGFYHQNYAHHGHSNVQHAYLLHQDPATFDAEFFGISAIESKAIDPQQRMLLEIVYEAIEDAGMSMDALRGSDTAVFAGLMCAEYEAILLRDLDTVPTYYASGTSRAILSNRISYLFDWHGASMTIDTACSSSLVAVHQAVQALRSGESRVAVACGANLILGPEPFIVESKVKMLSPDGRSRMWDKDANGYARGDGIAALILKPLSQALKDGDAIHCLIRETGVCQDGATGGITMPSAAAQKGLIHSTFRKAGLNPHLASDRPQYFEAHGTGTPAGDPIECEAIRTAFFGEGSSPAGDHPLYVGSIKTVLGHTEGTAGIAGILKAAWALKNSTIPPNLLFNELSSSVAPYYKDMEICPEAIPWPEPSNSQPRRASVNSFGFGGTNAHAILESYEVPENTPGVTEEVLFTPFVFSASSEYSLRANLQEYASYIERHPNLAVHNLSYTLRHRRSVLAYRAAFPADSAESLRTNILAKLGNNEGALGIRTPSKGGRSSRILGVFTGQGAQYARMGAELLEESPLAQSIISRLEAYLSDLPAEDRPDWSLKAELLRDSATSRLGEAVIAQPLCTAVQILLVDILAEAGISFSAVIGHSSGEIAAAYAAGWLSARDALVIAYYRGWHSRTAKSPNGNIQGAMLAVGMSMEEASELCEDPDFADRLALAASNSSSSVTISGDIDAIHKLQLVLDDEKRFNRLLKVDKAYHSKHMVPCAEPYIASLRSAGVKALKPTASNCTWFSSVYRGTPVTSDFHLSDHYWAENMVQPVLFFEATTAAATVASQLDLALELGPHPALQGPASQTIQEALQKKLPYHGVLDRKKGAIEALSTSLGFLWSHLDGSSVKLNQCQMALSAQKQTHVSLSQGLPTYQWNHQARHWHESRRSRKMRLRQDPFHPLLGHSSPDSAPHHLRWTNILKPSELSWLTGHRVQQQIVFPAAGYLSTAFEAAKALGEGRGAIRLIEVDDFHIHQAVSFESEDASVEILIELAQVTQPRPTEVLAKFSYSAALGSQATDLTLAASGTLKVYLGDVSPDLLPEREPMPPYLIPCERSRMYSFMENLEYNFADHFRSLDSIERKLGKSTCQAKRAVTHDSDSVMIHPVDLDAAFQSVMLAYSYPGDDEIRTLHLPASVSKVRINPALFASGPSEGEHLTLDSTCTKADRANPALGFSGSVKVYKAGCASAAIQLDHASFKPMGSGGSEPRNIFHKMHLVPQVPDGVSAGEGIPVTENDKLLLRTLSRLGTYYLRTFDEQVPMSAPIRSEGPLSFYLTYAHHMTQLVRDGKHQYAETEWLSDSLEDVQKEIKERKIENNAAIKIATLVGETMPRVFKGETTMLEHLRTSGLLDEYYANGIGTLESTAWLGGAVRQLTDRSPRLKILEVGAGTGSATKRILAQVGHSFDSYTFTDISSSFFENAAEVFEPWRDKMVFKVCDVEKDPVSQGFAEGEYDVVVASFILHATANLDRTVRNIRKLVKPGGYLVIGEGTNDGPFQSGDGLIFGTLPGWWLGAEEGRSLSPFVSAAQWDAILRRTGFSGLDTTAPPQFFDAFGVVLGLSQAVDDRVAFIREPLAESLGRPKISKLVLVGGETEVVGRLVDTLLGILENISESITVYKTLEEVAFEVCDESATVLVLSELDNPIFKSLNPEKWHSFRELFLGQRTVLWLTTGRNDDEPYSNMIVGFGRAATNENEDLRVQFLDIPDVVRVDPRMIAENLYVLHDTSLEEEGILYTAEPEVIVDEAGRQLVPRLRQMPVPNDRYNSIQHPITHETDASQAVFELRQEENDSYSRVLSRFELDKQTKGISDIIELRTTHTTLSAVKTPIGWQFVVLGVDSAENSFLTFTAAPKSTMQVPSELAVRYDGSSLPAAAFMALVVAVSGAKLMVDPLLRGQSVVVHNPSEYAAAVLSAYASIKEAKITFTTDLETLPESAASWVRLPPFLAQSDVHHVLPREVSCFVDLSAEPSDNVPTILSTLSPETRIETAKSLFSRSFAVSSLSGSAILGSTLTSLVQDIRQVVSSMGIYPAETVSIGDVARGVRPESPFNVIDWTVGAASLPVRVVRLDPKPLLKEDKTYWLCGMSGGLGLSLCDWLIDNGVKHLALTSRNPKMEPAWLEAHKKSGVTIKLLPCDVTNEDALRDVHKHIVETMPPIAGAVNGAMVLKDVSVRNMSLEDLEIAIRPKILGSIHLDRIFHDVNLDFFVLISSISGVIGTVGQANYAAANAGVCSLSAQRRNRGLNSSCINVGMMNGVGYITQSDRNLDEAMERLAVVHLSENDFRQSFAEAIEAGYPDSLNGPEFTLGLREISGDAVNLPKWAPNPKFAHFIVKRAAEAQERSDQGSGVPLPEQLRACKSPEDVLTVIEGAFCAQLRRVLQQPTPDEELLQLDSTSLGLDSLISVDIRSWFLKSFQVNIPVLKIMSSGVQMSSLAELAAENIPSALIPDVPGSEATASLAEKSDLVNVSSGTSTEAASTVSNTSSHSLATTPERTPSRNTNDGSNDKS